MVIFLSERDEVLVRLLRLESSDSSGLVANTQVNPRRAPGGSPARRATVETNPRLADGEARP
jgi:hypothetical protein